MTTHTKGFRKKAEMEKNAETLVWIGGVGAIRVWIETGREHNPPHVNAARGRGKGTMSSRIAIDPALQYKLGIPALPSDDVAQVRQWLDQNRVRVQQRWNELFPYTVR